MKTKKTKTVKVIIALPKEKDFSHLRGIPVNKDQLHVLLLVAKGYSNVQIGDSLGIDERSVEKRFERLYKTLEVQSNVMAFYRAIALGHISV